MQIFYILLRRYYFRFLCQMHKGHVGRALKFSCHLRQRHLHDMDTKIDFAVPNTAETSIRVYSITGKLVRTLLASQLSAGVYSISWDGRDARGHFVTSGIYIYHVQVGINRMSHKMTIVK